MDDGATPCFIAADDGHTDVLRILITEGQADVNKAKNDGRTPCFIAAQNGHADALHILIAEGQADVNKAMDNGATPCFLITEGQADVNKLLRLRSDTLTPCASSSRKDKLM
eukprot:TRINITY_DN257_c0_g1_i4.p3 TRINITY_DN257_c0_g1~~TRINITY_DN257_c0_g1_i4.p3  ORF type:complete len:111 (+),score=6.22 TRINITY_DN257_c0_g1_i4:384-716(+)